MLLFQSAIASSSLRRALTWIGVALLLAALPLQAGSERGVATAMQHVETLRQPLLVAVPADRDAPAPNLADESGESIKRRRLSHDGSDVAPLSTDDAGSFTAGGVIVVGVTTPSANSSSNRAYPQPDLRTRRHGNVSSLLRACRGRAPPRA